MNMLTRPYTGLLPYSLQSLLYTTWLICHFGKPSFKNLVFDTGDFPQKTKYFSPFQSTYISQMSSGFPGISTKNFSYPNKNVQTSQLLPTYGPQIPWLQIHFPFNHSWAQYFQRNGRRKRDSTGAGVSFLGFVLLAPSSIPLPYSDPHSWNHWSFHLEVQAQCSSQTNPSMGIGLMLSLSPMAVRLRIHCPPRSGSPKRAA